jgi:hypothetical protein
MRRYALRDDQRDRIQEFLPGREGRLGVTAKDNPLFVKATARCRRISTVPAHKKDGEDQAIGRSEGG